jgi:uncharacterized membrane protein YdjX (TVP38/TMEM64 family)
MPPTPRTRPLSDVQAGQPPSRSDGEPSSAPERRPWYDLGFNFTPRQALLLLGLLAVGVAFSYALDWAVTQFVDLDAERIEGWIDGFGLLAPLVYLLLIASTIIFTPLPSVPVDIAGGLAFGVVMGTLYTMVGSLLGATVNFYLARRLGRHFVERKLGRQAMDQVDGLAERMGAKLIFLTRLIPLFNFDWVSYAAGLTRMRYRGYAIASALGMLAPVIGIVYVGDVLLSHPGRSALVFTALVVWSAIPPVIFLAWAGAGALRRRLSGRRPSQTKARALSRDAEAVE